MKPFEVKILPKEKRIKTFSEIAQGFPKKACADEAGRCPQCEDAPCNRGCPLGIDVRGFVALLRDGKPSEALMKIQEANPFPSICGRVCRAPCEEACVLTEKEEAIGIRALERYAADNGKTKAAPKNKPAAGLNAKKIAIIGSGPAGMTAAYELAHLGYSVTIFEAHDTPGGILRYGIPEFRLPKRILETELTNLKALGVDIKTNVLVGRSTTLDEIFKQGFQAVLLAVGAGTPRFLDIPGTSLGGVYYAPEFLRRISDLAGNFAQLEEHFYLGAKVAVLGDDHAALDCARICARLGRKAALIFGETEDDTNIYWKEKQEAKEEGIQFESLNKPLEILSTDEGFVAGLKCVRLDFADSAMVTAAAGHDSGHGLTDESLSQWHLKIVEGSEFVIEADTVIIASGGCANPLLRRFSDHLKITEDGRLWISEMTGMTSLSRVFAAGEATSGAGSIVDAMASGKKAAGHIDRFLRR